LNPDYAFYPPEGIGDYGESGFVWSLGALTCYASSGHYVFGGRGGVYQYNHPEVELPTLRKEHFALTPIVKRCLCYSPSQRISINELHTIAIKGLESINQLSRVKRSIEPSETENPPECSDDTWLEKMG
jgi:serine/threonine protein kinase